jgi:diguanylate cyclase (GGDEF)-like protein
VLDPKKLALFPAIKFMPSPKSRWGIVLCLLSLPIPIGLFFLAPAVPAGLRETLFQKTVPITGLVFAVFLLFLGSFSYARLHSAKVYFLGYGIGVTGMAYFLARPIFTPSHLPTVPPGFAELTIIISLLNFIISSFLPPGAKYRTVRSIMLFTIVIEAVLLIVFRLSPAASSWLAVFRFSGASDLRFWTVPLLAFGALFASILNIRKEFYLGGVIAGSSIIYVALWLCPLVTAANQTQGLKLFIAAAALFYLSAGLVIHGFSRMEHRIAYDPLLQIYNRDYCGKIITEQANLNMAPPFAMAMVDIDHFKNVNDTYGHHAGDCVLYAVAQAVRSGAGDGIACRYGGEELAVFFPQKNTAQAVAIVEKIRTTIEKIKTKVGKKTITVTVSAGVSHREEFTQPIAEVIKAADKALYTAKKKGRNQVRSQKTVAG